MSAIKPTNPEYTAKYSHNVKIYSLKLITAFLNLILVSYVVRELPTQLSAQYLLALAYVGLGALVVGLGIDTALERYGLRTLKRWSKNMLAGFILILSTLRLALLAGGVYLSYLFFADSIELAHLTLVLAFTTILHTSFSNLLNGVLLYTHSAVSNILKAIVRFGIIILPEETLALDTLLYVEITATLLSAIFALAVFKVHELESANDDPDYNVMAKFMGWNWIASLMLNLMSLNTLKILILRSGHPDSVIIAYGIQLTEAVERFLPSLVLAGKYRPSLARDFDSGKTADLMVRLRFLGARSTAISAAIAIAQLILLPLAFLFIQNVDPKEFFLLVGLCGIWLFVSNINLSLNIVSNILEASHIPFLVSLLLCVLFFCGLLRFNITSPVEMFSFLAFFTALYPIVWLVLSRYYLCQIFE